MPISIYLYVTYCDRVYQRALDSGGTSVFPIMTLPSGERYGGVKDPCGNIWWVAAHVEDVPPRRARTTLERIQNAINRKRSEQGLTKATLKPTADRCNAYTDNMTTDHARLEAQR